MTAISTLLSMGMLPLNVFIYSQLAYDGDVLNSLDWNALGSSLAVVVSAISSGLFISAKFKTATLSKYSNLVCSYLVLHEMYLLL
jgi:sodium/bile acid cotransporter 2